MAFSYGWRGPNIVKEGLVLYLDAGSPNSFYSPTAGTTWKDISGSGNNGTLINGPTYSSANGGGIVFDGVDDYVNCSTKPVVNNIFTINSWASFSELGSIGPAYNKRKTIMSYSYPYSPNTGFVFIGSSNNGTDIFISLGQDQKLAVSTTGYISLNQPVMLTAVCNGANDLIRLYKNGVEVNYVAQTNADINLTYTIAPYLGVRDTTTFPDLMKGSIFNLQFYNRALSVAEITQNYNATKTRFGL